MTLLEISIPEALMMTCYSVVISHVDSHNSHDQAQDQRSSKEHLYVTLEVTLASLS